MIVEAKTYTGYFTAYLKVHSIQPGDKDADDVGYCYCGEVKYPKEGV